MYQKEQLKEDFIKINPQHTVPTLDDNGFILTESRAIGIYLAEKYFPDGHSLYPKDVQQRALINARLQFDCGTLYPRIRAIQVNPIQSLNTSLVSNLILIILPIFCSGNLYILVIRIFPKRIAKIYILHWLCSINFLMAINM